MTIDPEKFGRWRVEFFLGAVGIVIILSLVRELLIKQEANPVVLGWAISASIIPVGGLVALRWLRGWKGDQ